MASSSAACVLGGVRLISSARIMFAKTGPCTKIIFRPSLGVLKNFRAGDVRGHEVGRELDALELQVENLRDGFDEQRLGQSRRAGDEAMAAGKKRDQHLLDHFLLADDDLGKFGFDARAAGDELFDGLRVGGLISGAIAVSTMPFFVLS